MSRVEKRKSIATARAVERAAKRQCKKDERQTEALLAKVRNWSAHVFDPKSAESYLLVDKFQTKHILLITCIYSLHPACCHYNRRRLHCKYYILHNV